MMQDPDSAQFESMPNAIILKDHPVRILSPRKLAKALMDFLVTQEVV